MPLPVNLQSKLARYLGEQPEAGQADGTDYYKRFAAIDEYLNDNVHPDVNEGAAVAAQLSGDSAGWLTDHGLKHVQTVIKRASDLLGQQIATGRLHPYEAYLLLIAIHLHDVGNLLGREEHEKKILEIMGMLGPTLMGNNELERRMITRIAMAHGGSVGGSKDTLAKVLAEYDPYASEGPRTHFLAAVLRIADELAEDWTRANRFALDSETGRTQVRGSEVFHMYADRLRMVSIKPEEGTAELKFTVVPQHLTTLYRKQDTKVLLFDEIRERVLKLYRECVYCRRFLLPHVHLDRVKIKIDVFSDTYGDPLHKELFVLQETGYPTYPESLEAVTDDTRDADGAVKNGAWLKAFIESKIAAGS
jgi:hypothetical protein